MRAWRMLPLSFGRFKGTCQAQAAPAIHVVKLDYSDGRNYKDRDSIPAGQRGKHKPQLSFPQHVQTKEPEKAGAAVGLA